MTVIALVSGGIDSLVMSKMISLEGENLIPVFVDYGQLARMKEWSACQKVFKESGLSKPVKVDLSGYGKFMSTGITDPTKHIYDDAFLPEEICCFF